MCLLGTALVEIGFFLHLLLGELLLPGLMHPFKLENGLTVVPQHGSPGCLITDTRTSPYRGNMQRPGLLKVQAVPLSTMLTAQRSIGTAPTLSVHTNTKYVVL